MRVFSFDTWKNEKKKKGTAIESRRENFFSLKTPKTNNSEKE
jgi:hypothetical protein